MPLEDELLPRLIEKGALPKYAFPTDVATFYVFDQAKSTGRRPAFREAPSQGLSIALSQYAPGKEVWINNRRYRSGAIYSPFKGERKRMWERRELYYECQNCHFAQTRPLTQGAVGDIQDCPACGREKMFGEAQLWIRPVGFAHPIFYEEDTSPDDGPAPSFATRAKLMAPGPSHEHDWHPVNERVRVHHFRSDLLVTNRGPRDAGYDYCAFCGYIEPTAQPQSRVTTPHAMPTPSKDTACKLRPVRNLVLGTKFRTDVLLVSIRVDEPLTLYPGLPSTDTALRTACEAIAAAACKRLDLEPGELRAEYRPALTNAGKDGREAEIFLYDTLPGGAGFSKRVGELAEEILTMALQVLDNCQGNCDCSCYRCLRNFKNKLEHGLLDRAVGAGLIRYLLDGTEPSLPLARVQSSTQLIYEDLKRQEVDGLQVSLNKRISVPGIGTITAPVHVLGPTGDQRVIAVGEPLCRDTPCDRALVDVMELSTVPVKVVSELLVRANLPAVTTAVCKSLGSGAAS